MCPEETVTYRHTLWLHTSYPPHHVAVILIRHLEHVPRSKLQRSYPHLARNLFYTVRSGRYLLIHCSRFRYVSRRFQKDTTLSVLYGRCDMAMFGK